MEQEKLIERVLLIDDDATTNHVNKRLLVRSGMVGQVEVAENGNQALEYLRNGSEEVPELIMLDLQMEGMDGFSFLDAYRKLPDSQKAKRLIALTSSASFYDLNKLKEYPEVSEHLYKPFTQEQLKELMTKYFED